jgi:hypothetical protein
MLCKKIVSFFSLLSQSQETGSHKLGITQELLSLITGLAHYLKILIRIALTAALKLEREYGNATALSQFLGRLERLARDPDAIKPGWTGESSAHPPRSESKRTKPFGYKSLQKPLNTPIGHRGATTDLCEACRATIEEECARFGASRRWHLTCLACSTCRRPVLGKERDGDAAGLPMRDFRLDCPPSGPDRIVCAGCASASGLAGESLEPVTRLEQYAFLLCVALNKLYDLLKSRGAVSYTKGGTKLPNPCTAI